MNKYDVIVIGSGTGGQTAAHDLKSAGLNVALVDNSSRPGGICAIAGCQAKKWFYETAEVIAKSRHLKAKGITTAATGDWSAVWKQKEMFTQEVPENTVNGLFEAGIEYVKGTAQFNDAHTVDVDSQTLGADFFVIATGARPAPLPINGAEHLITSTEFLEHRHLPQRIVFVGGGFISFEFAHFSARIGPETRQVTIMEVSDRPLGIFDEEMVDLLLKASAADGIEVKTNTHITTIDRQDDAFRIHLDSGQTTTADLVVHGASRVPEVEGLHLESLGVETTPRGIQVNAFMQTKLGHIFAVGDCAATPALARVADYEGHVAAQNIVSMKHGGGGELRAVDYAALPFVLFTYPQYGMVGQTEAALKNAGIAYRKSKGTHVKWPTFRRVGIENAGYKILVAEDDTILGAHVVSDNPAGLINTFKQAMIDDTPAAKLYWDNIMSPYPSRESDIIYMLRPLVQL